MADAMRVDLATLDDPRLAPYTQVKQRQHVRAFGRFIAEGEQVVRRLLRSRFQTESVLASRSRAARIAADVPDRAPLYVLEDALLECLLGFAFHSGVMACGIDPPGNAAPRPPRGIALACEDINSAVNIGALMRTGAGFGVDQVVLGPRCIDPLLRQAIRVSMGAVFQAPWRRCDDLAGELRRLRASGARVIATVLDDAATPLHAVDASGPLVVLLGGEAQGLPADLIAEADLRVTIPMQLGTDSLNVAVAAAVFLYHFSGRGRGLQPAERR